MSFPLSVIVVLDENHHVMSVVGPIDSITQRDQQIHRLNKQLKGIEVMGWTHEVRPLRASMGSLHFDLPRTSHPVERTNRHG